MRLLALDQSSIITGWAIFQDKKLEKFDKIVINKDLPVGERLYQIREAIIKIIKDENIDTVVFEDIQLQSNVGNNVVSFKVLAEVFGIVYEIVSEYNLNHAILGSSTWKSRLKIRGKNRPEQKRAAAQYVLDTYGVKAIQDICDAICIGNAYIMMGDTKPNFDWS